MYHEEDKMIILAYAVSEMLMGHDTGEFAGANKSYTPVLPLIIHPYIPTQTPEED